jgi:hypothetical protein
MSISKVVDSPVEIGKRVMNSYSRTPKRLRDQFGQETSYLITFKAEQEAYCSAVGLAWLTAIHVRDITDAWYTDTPKPNSPEYEKFMTPHYNFLNGVEDIRDLVSKLEPAMVNHGLDSDRLRWVLQHQIEPANRLNSLIKTLLLRIYSIIEEKG